MIRIPSLDETLDEQRDLSTLCRDRELITSEIFHPNDYYGNAAILKLYCGIPQDYSLKVVVPHAISFSTSQTTPPEAEFPLPVVWCYPPYRINAFREKTLKIVINSS